MKKSVKNKGFDYKILITLFILCLLLIISLGYVFRDQYTTAKIAKNIDFKEQQKTTSRKICCKEIKFSLSSTFKDCMYDNQIIAEIDGKKYYYTEHEEYSLCLVEIIDVRDFNNNGYEDALIGTAPACGGNALPEMYLFCTYDKDRDKIVITKEFGLGDSPTIERWKNTWLLSYSEDYDIETDSFKLILENTHIKFIEKTINKPLKAVFEVHYYDVGYSDEQFIKYYDIDNDGIKDKITCEDHGYLNHCPNTWSVKLSKYPNIKKQEFDIFRLGVLKTITNGVHDLVIDNDDIYKWNGKKFILKKN